MLSVSFRYICSVIQVKSVSSYEIVSVVDGFSCYSCKNGEACDDINEEMKSACESPLGAVTTCIKAKVSGNIVRACGVPGTNLNECQSDKGVTVCLCSGDSCNGATAIDGWLSLLATGLVVGIYITLGV